VSRKFVIDASIALAWVHPSQATPGSLALLAELEAGAKVTVPGIWFAETANALLVLERRRKLASDERINALGRLGSLDISADEEFPRVMFGRVSELAAEHGLSVYDASYLELALRQRIPLASNDAPLKEAARQCGVKLV
jgi:predicted nucleic acid-binding protein